MPATSDKITRLRAQAREYGLSGLTFIERFSDDELAEVYNGIGPEWFPAKIRRAIDELHSDLECCALIHDVRFACNDGTTTQFNFANAELEANGVLVANAKYAWYDPRRYIRRHQARVFADLCQCFGWSAYIAARINRLNPKRKE